MATSIVAGGMESMSNAPYLLPKARTGYRMGNGEMVDSVVHDGLWCAFEHVHMGEEAEIVADKYQISREAQDQFAYQSHMKAHAATEAGRFRDEIVPSRFPRRRARPSSTATSRSARIPASRRSASSTRPSASRTAR